MTKLFVSLEGVKQTRNRNQLYFDSLRNQNKITNSYHEYLSQRNRMCYKTLKHNGIYDKENYLFIPITSSKNDLKFSRTFEEFINKGPYTCDNVKKFNEKCYISPIVWSLKENQEFKNRFDFEAYYKSLVFVDKTYKESMMCYYLMHIDKWYYKWKKVTMKDKKSYYERKFKKLNEMYIELFCKN